MCQTSTNAEFIISHTTDTIEVHNSESRIQNYFFCMHAFSSSCWTSFIAICLIRKDHRKRNELKSLLIFFILLTEYFLHSTRTVKGEKLSNTYNDDMDMYTLSSGDSSCISSSITGICHIEVWDYSFFNRKFKIKYVYVVYWRNCVCKCVKPWVLLVLEVRWACEDSHNGCPVTGKLALIQVLSVCHQANTQSLLLNSFPVQMLI